MSVKVGMLAAKLNEGFLFLVFDAQRSCQSVQIKFCEVVCTEVWQLFLSRHKRTCCVLSWET